jgi:competence ComEA-like helix-hairpin-helix protein
MGVWLIGTVMGSWGKISSLWGKPQRVGVPRGSLHALDSLMLLNVPGLSPYRVEKFLRARSELGPFRSWEEVGAVLDSAAAARMADLFLGDFPIDTFTQENLNGIDSVGLVALGWCRPVAAGRLVRYRYKIGGFSEWGQIDSLRGLTALERYRLRRHGFLGAPNGIARRPNSQGQGPNLQRLDLNAASVADLERLPGIGLKTAERIVRYRERLGYFASVAQLREVWGLREENLEKALPYLTVRTQGRPLSLRTASVEELARHPYISWSLAKRLVKARAGWKAEPIPLEVWREWIPDSLRGRLEPYLTGE